MTKQHDQLTSLLSELFVAESSENLQRLSLRLLQSAQRSGVDSLTSREPTSGESRWSGGTSVLITYADTLQRDQEPGLLTLSEVINRHFSPLAAVVHVLPFLRASSDGGFAVASHEELEPRLGDWAYLELLSRGRTLMADLVLNHVSASHPWVQQFMRDEAPGLDEPQQESARGAPPLQGAGLGRARITGRRLRKTERTIFGWASLSAFSRLEYTHSAPSSGQGGGHACHDQRYGLPCPGV